MVKVEDRFEAKVDRSGDCHEWNASIGTHGYGVFGIGRKIFLAHRVAWEIERGPIPDGLLVRHKCDNRKCVNIDHLESGTHQDNSNDMVSRGRHKRANAKINTLQAREIKSYIMQGCKHRDIATFMGAPLSIVKDISRGQTWKNA